MNIIFLEDTYITSNEEIKINIKPWGGCGTSKYLDIYIQNFRWTFYIRIY